MNTPEDLNNSEASDDKKVVLPAERSPAEAHADAAGTSVLQQIVSLFPADAKVRGSQLLLKLMEEARAEGAPPARKRNDTPFNRASFKKNAEDASPAQSGSAPEPAPGAPKYSPFEKKEGAPGTTKPFRRGRGL